ncbi:unnamed protein product [Symbiodinium sp. CCMP2592]|nr:unnamed protein product [Symbiodinium sp. CCMP2592]
MVLVVMVFEFGVYAGKQVTLKEEQAYALEMYKYNNKPQLDVPGKQPHGVPSRVVASYQEEPNTHYNPEPKEPQNKKYYTIMENLGEKLQYLVNSVEIAKEEFESLKYMFFSRGLESSYAPVITVKFHYFARFIMYVFEGRIWSQSMKLLVFATTAPGMILLEPPFAVREEEDAQGMANLFEHLAAAGEQREQNLVGALQNVLQQSRSDMALSQEALSSRIKEVLVESREKGEIQLHKLVKAPEAFSPSTWQEERSSFAECKHRLRTWLGAIDDEILTLMNKAEKEPAKELEFDKLSVKEKTQSKKLYSILSSYTRNRPQRVVTAVKEENGIEAYRQLVNFNQPNTKARSLQLHREVMSFRFDKDKTYNENFLKFEELIDDYEKASSEKTSDSFKMGTVFDSVPAQVRQHILLNIKEDTTYNDLRSFLTTYENAKRWTQPTTTDLINSGKDHGGQAAMDVRQVTLYHIGEEPEQAHDGPQIYPIDSEEETNYEITYFNNIMMVQVEDSLCDDSEGEESQGWKEDPLYQWYSDREELVLSVRTVTQEPLTKPRNIEVILDSGADVSIAPTWMRKYGKKVQVKSVQLRDAQGRAIAVQVHRLINLEFKDKRGNKVQVAEVFMIGNVINPLLAIGKMMKQGWMPHGNDQSGMSLVDSDRHTEIPIYFRNNSLATSAFVQAVVAVREGQLVPVILSDALQFLEKEQRPGWSTPAEGTIHHGMNNSHFVDPTMTRSFHESLFYRTTFAKENKDNSGQWILVEINRPYQEMEDPFMELPYGDTETITIFTAQPESPVRYCKAKGTDHNVEFEVFTDDSWEVSETGEEVIRHHRTQRKFLFNPAGIPGCPTDLNNFDGNRVTYGINEDTGRSFENNLSFKEQPALQDQMPMRPSLLWTGETRFRLREPLQAPKKKQRTEAHESMEVDEEAKPSGEEAQEAEEADKEEEKEPAAPKDRREVERSLTFVHEGWEYSVETTLKDLRDLCRELGVSSKGTKKELLLRLSRATRADFVAKNRASQEKAYKEKMRLWAIDVKDAFLQVPQKAPPTASFGPHLQEASWNEFLQWQETVLPSIACSQFCVSEQCSFRNVECLAVGSAVCEPAQKEHPCRSRVTEHRKEKKVEKEKMSQQEMLETLNHLLDRVENQAYKLYELETRVQTLESQLGKGKATGQKGDKKKGSQGKGKEGGQSGSSQQPNPVEQEALSKLLEESKAEEKRKEEELEQEKEKKKAELRHSFEEYFGNYEEEEKSKEEKQKEKMETLQGELAEMEATAKARRKNLVEQYYTQEKNLEEFYKKKAGSAAGSTAGDDHTTDERYAEEKERRQSEGRRLHSEKVEEQRQREERNRNREAQFTYPFASGPVKDYVENGEIYQHDVSTGTKEWKGTDVAYKHQKGDAAAAAAGKGKEVPKPPQPPQEEATENKGKGKEAGQEKGGKAKEGKAGKKGKTVGTYGKHTFDGQEYDTYTSPEGIFFWYEAERDVWVTHTRTWM